MYIVYKTVNIITDQYYIGVHNDTDPSYFGSGVRIKRSVKKYGRKNFTRITLYDNLTEDAAFGLERSLLESCLTDPLCLNLGDGGKGGSNFKGKTHSEDTKRRISQANSRPRGPKTAEQIEKARLARIRTNGGQFFSDDTIEKFRHIQTGKMKLSETKRTISEGVKRSYKNKPELRKTLSDIRKNYFSNPDNRKKHSETMKAVRRRKNDDVL